jgi:hypothetical protein
MVQQREEDQVAKAIRATEAVDDQKCHKKKARKWKLTGALLLAEVYETGLRCRF